MPTPDYQLSQVGRPVQYPWNDWIASAAKAPVVLRYGTDYHINTEQFCDHGRRFIKKHNLTPCCFRRGVSTRRGKQHPHDPYNVIVITLR